MIDWTAFEVGEHRLPCEACSRRPMDKSLGITINSDGSGVARCFRCDFKEFYRQGGNRCHPEATVPRVVPPATREKRDTLSDYGQAVWADTVALRGTIGAEYLVARECVLPPRHSDLRFHPALKHHCGYVGPALVALITHAITGEPMSLHRTWIKADGTKGDVDPPRMLLGGHRKANGVIRLWPDEAVTTGLAICEGIESALSLAHAYQPAWACIDAGNLATFPLLGGIECLMIGADHDRAGVAAARLCGDRWAASGVEVLIAMPDPIGLDMNDVAMGALQ